MKIYLYQRFDIKNNLFEFLSKDKNEVHQFMLKDLSTIGISNYIDKENPENNIDYNDWDPKDIVDIFNEGGHSAQLMNQMIFLRFDEFEI